MLQCLSIFRGSDRQPPCEAVSWNEIGESHKLNSPVSLLVRLWVEIIYHQTELFHEAVSLLVRLWVEMSNTGRYDIINLVSLLVRLWVEMSNTGRYDIINLVSLLVRLWVEMSPCGQPYTPLNGQPPCEAVSWNVRTSWTFPGGSLSASLWGCELKYHQKYLINGMDTSASLWGCELKFCYFFPGHSLLSQPPCEAVSWNAEFLEFDCFIVTAK